MATKPPRPCRQRGCVALVRSASGYCSTHERAHNATHNARRNASMGSGWAWSRQRAAVLAEEPRCRVCGGRATHVDHIIPLANGGTSDRANLQPICNVCHAVKSANEHARRTAVTR